MRGQESERERLKRIREEQLSARDPTRKERQMQQRLVRRHSKKSGFDFETFASAIPAKTWLMILGALVGLLLAIITNIIVQADWARYVGIGLILYGLVVGRILGGVRDWGDEDWG